VRSHHTESSVAERSDTASRHRSTPRGRSRRTVFASPKGQKKVPCTFRAFRIRFSSNCLSSTLKELGWYVIPVSIGHLRTLADPLNGCIPFKAGTYDGTVVRGLSWLQNARVARAGSMRSSDSRPGWHLVFLRHVRGTLVAAFFARRARRCKRA
jgi:hypothetical protein